MPKVTFYFDLGSPYAYLAAERLDTLLPEPIEWSGSCREPQGDGRSSWSLGDEGHRQAGMVEIEHRARAYGLPPVRWPEPWPTNYLTAMLATMFAFTVGRGREFTLRAFRNAFQEGSDQCRGARVRGRWAGRARS